MQSGFIYKLTSPSTNKIYIGSTTLTINNRLIRHRASFRRFNRNRGRYYSAYELMMYPDVVCEIIERVDFNDKEFLRERENFHIFHNDNCVNIRNAKFDYDTYYMLNKERIKAYYQANSIKKNEYQKNRYKRIKLLKNPVNLLIRDI